MYYKQVVAPATVFCVGLAVSLAAWILLPEDVAAAAGASSVALAGPLLLTCASALLVFALGSFSAVLLPGRAAHVHADSPAVLALWVKRLTCISLICFLAIVGLTVVQAGSFDVLRDTMSGRQRLASFEGLTTLVHASTAGAALLIAGVALHGWHRMVAGTRNFHGLVALLFVLIGARAFLGSERVAIYLPLIAAIVIFMVRSVARVSWRFIGVTAVVCSLVAALFVGSEYFRSYGVKRADYGLEETLWSYGLNRLLLYYGVSVNTGGAMLEVVQEGHGHEPLFKNTFNPARKVLDLLSGGEEPVGSLAEMIEWSGLYNPEFNNVWGFASPFTEGTWVGLVYWLIWGFVATRCWMRARSSGADAFTLAIFGVLTAGLVDVARVNALGTVHVLVPLGLLVLVRRMTRVLPPVGMQPGQAPKARALNAVSGQD